MTQGTTDRSAATSRRYMTGAEVADLFRTSESTVRYWKFVGKINGIRVGRRSLYAVEDVEALISAARDGGEAA